MRRPATRAICVVLACAAAACTDTAPSPRAGETAAWHVDTTALLSLGATDADTSHEFADVSGAVRLPGGEIVVSENASRQLRWFSATGERLGTSGRRGGGPGEFAGRITVARYRTDTVAVWDEKLGRWSVFDSSRRFAHLLDATMSATASKHRMVRAANRTLVVGVFADVGVPDWVDAVVDSLRRAGALGTRFREGIVDDVGLLWLRAPGDSLRWDVVAPNATILGSARLPRAFEPYQIGAAEVLGKFTDTTGFEFVRAYRLERPASARSAAATTAIVIHAAADTPRGWDRDVRRAAMELVTAEEAYYADHMTYGVNPQKVMPAGLGGFKVEILGANRFSWRGTVTETRTGAMCVLITGDTRWPVFEQSCFP